jgi:ATP-dependent exoDNAse (exonuclease V) alpha subunit
VNSEIFKNKILQNFPFEPTNGQQQLISKIADFFFALEQRNLFVVNGYAGTGKTSIVKAIVNSLSAISFKSVLLAPTGRAAKVLSNYTDQQALTIHKKIYHRKNIAEFGWNYMLQQNLHTNTIFIVDEASMISNLSAFGTSSTINNRSLLDDLIQYVYSGINCKLILIGDSAQLPPVGLNVSPALDLEYLKTNYSITLHFSQLTDVVRQAENSGILYNATKLREQIAEGQNFQPQFYLNRFKDVVQINGEMLEDALQSAYGKYGSEDCMIITRSNKRANQFNQQIRARIKWQENELSAGDYMMVVKNNYHWLPEESKAGFIANGDIIQVSWIGNIYEMYDFTFANVRVRMIDYENEPELELKILLNAINAETPALSADENKRLYEKVSEDYNTIADKKTRQKKIKEDPHFNALQVKFAYAVTCHKSQGGQWPCIFVDQGYLTSEHLNKEYLRWLYTAITRASNKLYLVNFNQDFYVD